MLFWHLGLTAAVIFLTLGRRRIDYRVVLLGAILPDLIDKPIGRIFFEKEFQTSRLFGHTLLVWVVLLLAIQLTLRGATARRWFILPIAAMLHLALDGMWNDPVTLFWPLFGTEFPKVPVETYWLEVLTRPLEYPWVAIQELVGLGLLIYLGFAYRLHESVPRREFLRTGTLAEPRGAGQRNAS
jgi:inner membrane protein